MRFLKKVVSCLMAGIIAVTAAVCMSVGAGAEESKKDYFPSIKGFYEADNSFYCIELRDVSIDLVYNAPIVDIYFPSCGWELWLVPVNIDGKTDYDAYLLYNNDNNDYYKLKDGNANNIVIVDENYNTKFEGYGYSFYFDPDDTNIDTILKEKKASFRFWRPKDDKTVYYDIEGTESANATTYTVEPDWGKAISGGEKSDIASADFSKITNKNYTGKARKPEVTVKNGDKTLKEGTDYTLSYKNNKKIGTATVTVTGKGDWMGTKKLTFKIVPPKTTLKASKSGDKIKLSWKAAKGAEKYQIYYSTNGGKYKRLATVSGDKTSYSTSKLDFKKNTYKFKIRSYAESGGKKYYSSYSKAISLK